LINLFHEIEAVADAEFVLVFFYSVFGADGLLVLVVLGALVGAPEQDFVYVDVVGVRLVVGVLGWLGLAAAFVDTELLGFVHVGAFVGQPNFCFNVIDLVVGEVFEG